MSERPARVAVVGAGMAGATCARGLADHGLSVEVFDKARGVGGRMATRRARWATAKDTEREARFDHGVPGFTAHESDFAEFVGQASGMGLVARWAPRLAPGADASLGRSGLWVSTPDMPSLSRALLAGLTVHTEWTVSSIHQSPAGWALCSPGGLVFDGFDAVVIAIPPQQAATLLQPHQPEWAQRAEAQQMLPGWVMMGVTDEPCPALPWDMAWPSAGPLHAVIRNDRKPGRALDAGFAHWVVHATPAWSQSQLEAPATQIQASLQLALSEWLGHALAWRHAAVHRWRYAAVAQAEDGDAPPSAAGSRCWWDAPRGMGVCGDALGGAGVEGAWRSGRALASAMLQSLTLCKPDAQLAATGTLQAADASTAGASAP